MKKAELLKMLEEAKTNPEVLKEAIAKLSSKRGIAFTREPEVEGLEAGKWYTLDQDGKAVSVPAMKTKEDGTETKLVPGYRKI